MRALSTTTAVVLAVCTATVLASTSPMPFRPGYGMGAWIPKDVVASMKEEAERRTNLMTLDNADAEARSVERELKMVADNLGGDLPQSTVDKVNGLVGSIQAKRRAILSQKVTAVQGWLNQLDATAKRAGEGKTEDKDLTLFRYGKYQSAVDWSTTTITTKDRGFDSINVGVHFVRKSNSTQDGDGMSHGEKVARELKKNAHSVSGRVTEIQREASKMAAQKTATTEAHHDVVGTMLITAFATHRGVRQFENLKMIPWELHESWNSIHGDDRVADPLAQHQEFVKQMKQERHPDVHSKNYTIDMVSEMYLGSVLVGMVHFVQKESVVTNNNQTANAKAQKFANDISQNVRNAQKAASEVGSTAIAMEEARRMAKLGSEAGLDVQFDLVSIGYIPKLTTDPVQQAVSKFANFDPAQFQIPSPLVDATAVTGLAAVQSNMASVIDATVTALAKTTESREVMDEKSLMDAFTDFTETTKSSTDVGAPIGLNIAQFTKLDVLSALANKYLNTGIDLGVDV